MRWTPQRVEERLKEAAETLFCLPLSRVPGYKTSWPPVIRDYWEMYGWHVATARLPVPSARAIQQMDEALTWLSWLSPEDSRLVWLRACQTPWKVICLRYRIHRVTAWRNWVAALIVIATQLDPSKKPTHYFLSKATHLP